MLFCLSQSSSSPPSSPSSRPLSPASPPSFQHPSAALRCTQPPLTACSSCSSAPSPKGRCFPADLGIPGCGMRASTPTLLRCGSLAASRSPSLSPLGCLALGPRLPGSRVLPPLTSDKSWLTDSAAGLLHLAVVGERQPGRVWFPPRLRRAESLAEEGLGSRWVQAPPLGGTHVRSAPPLCSWQV